MNIKKTVLAAVVLAGLAISVAGFAQEKYSDSVLAEIQRIKTAHRNQEIIITIVKLGLIGGVGCYLLQGLPAEQKDTILARAAVVLGAYVSIVHILPTFILLNARGGL